MIDNEKGQPIPAMDYRFGWRWLLPGEAHHKQICLLGFDDAELSFWRTVLSSATFIKVADGADCWIINTDTAVSIPCPAAIEKVSTICLVGSGSSVSRWRKVLNHCFADIREYGLLSHRNPRVVVPLGSQAHAVHGLGLHRPGRRIAQLGVRFARLLASLGVYAPLRRRLLLIATRVPGSAPIAALEARVAEYLPETVLDYALYLGTPNDNRKTLILPLGKGVPDTIMKSASSPIARNALVNEHQALSALLDTPLGGRVPLVRGLVDAQGSITLYQEYRQRVDASSGQIRSSALDFLCGLSRQGRVYRSLHDYLASTAELSNASAPVKQWLTLRSRQGAQICRHRGHGDFASWNVSWTSKGLFVYDWEESRADMPAFWDGFYYVAAPALHIEEKADPALVAGQCLAFARQLASASGLETLDVACHFVLWCLDRIALDRFYQDMLMSVILEHK